MSDAHGICDMVLLHNGLVLMPGGDVRDVAELYDPVTGTWSLTGTMNRPRGDGHTTLLPDGRVLVAGGFNGGGFVPQTELYDPSTGIWTDTASLLKPRRLHTQTLLADGRVLVAGGLDNLGDDLSHAEIYDPATGSWTETGSMTEPRVQATANLLANDTVLVISGATSEEYNPEQGTWRTGQVQLTHARTGHTTTTLLDGSLIVAGGNFADHRVRPAERLYAAAVSRADGSLLVAGDTEPYFT
jgi:hypothetical protein